MSAASVVMSAPGRTPAAWSFCEGGRRRDGRGREERRGRRGRRRRRREEERWKRKRREERKERERKGKRRRRREERERRGRRKEKERRRKRRKESKRDNSQFMSWLHHSASIVLCDVSTGTLGTVYDDDASLTSCLELF